MDKKRTPARNRDIYNVRLYGNGQYDLDAVLQLTGFTASELTSWRNPAKPRAATSSKQSAKLRIARLKSEIEHLRRERRAARDAIAALAKAALPVRASSRLY
jgi:hypothetical protein